jgi:hypothetical protein
MMAAVIVESLLAYEVMIMPTSKELAITSIAALGFLAASSALLGKAEANSHISFGFGFSSPVYAQPYYAPPPVYYAPPPVVYAPPPVYDYPPPRVYYPPSPPGFSGSPPGYYTPQPFYAQPPYYRGDDDD